MVELAQNMLQLFETPWFVYFVALCVLIVILPFVHTMMNDRRRARFYRRHGLSCPRRGTLFGVVWIMFTVGIAVLIFGVTIGFSWVISRVNTNFGGIKNVVASEIQPSEQFLQDLWQVVISPAFLLTVAGVIVVAFVVLLSVRTWRRRVEKKYKQWERVAGEVQKWKKEEQWPKDQEWRKATGIQYLEDLKAALCRKENFLKAGEQAASDFISRRDSTRGFGPAFSEMLKESRSIPLNRDRRQISKADYDWAINQCVKIDRIWAGNVHMEFEDLNVRIAKLQLQKSYVPDDFKKIDALLSKDYDITELQREQRDLTEIVKRAKQRKEEEDKKKELTPHQAKFKDTRTIRQFDREHGVAETFHSALDMRDTIEKRDDLINQVENSNLEPEDKKLVQEHIRASAQARIEELSPKSKTNIISIYEKEM